MTIPISKKENHILPGSTETWHAGVMDGRCWAQLSYKDEPFRKALR